MDYDEVDFNAQIAIYIDGFIKHRKCIRNVGSMLNTKRQATIFAKEHGFRGKGKWETHRTHYDPRAGRQDSWESSAVRNFVNYENQQAKVRIYRA